MGEVYQAFDNKHDRVVALRLLPEVFSKDDEVIDIAANPVTATIPVGDAPTSVGVLPKRTLSLCNESESRKVTILRHRKMS